VAELAAGRPVSDAGPRSQRARDLQAAPEVRRRRWLLPWTIGYALLALPFHPLWPDFEAARLGIGLALGGFAVVGLALLRSESDLPFWLHATWLGLTGLHCLSSAWAENVGDAWARSLWLVALWAFATLAARTSSLRQQLAAIEWIGITVAGFGLAQGAGVSWPLGYSIAADAVSTLGNRNVAAEFAVLALVASSLRLLRHHRVAASAVAVVLGAGYLWLNHSRSALLAGGLTLLPLVAAPWRQHPTARRLLLLGLLALGAGLGALVAAAAPPAPKPAEPGATATASDLASPSTIAVRTEMWGAGLRMVAAAPALGVGAAQFKVHYPRFRTQREIELSTHGREFAAAPQTVHEDPLEIAIEVGLFGFCLYATFWLLVLLRRRRAVMGLLPVVAFLVLGLVRSPIGNAPAAAFAFACVGALAREQQVRAATRRRWLPVLLLLAVAMLVVGARMVAAQCAAARYVGLRVRPLAARRALTELHALDTAVELCPWDGSLRELQVGTRLELALARADRETVRAMLDEDGGVARLLALKPHGTTALLLAARAHEAAGDLAAAAATLQRLLALDPGHPDARLFLATLHVRSGDAALAVATLYGDGAPHPRLRRGLAEHLGDLAKLARADADRAVLQHEADFVAAIDALAADRSDATDRVIAFVRGPVAGAARDDLRPLVLLAAASLRQHDREAAEQAATKAPASAHLAPVHARLLHEVLQPLRDLPAWRRRLETTP